jgi:predicted HTH domain antitoxin
MNTVSIQVPDSAVAVFANPDDDLGKSILAAAVVKWYELGKVSQAKAAEILGLSRANFLDLLAAYRVSAWQYTKEEMDEELGLD